MMKKVLIIISSVFLIGIISVFGINTYVINKEESNIYDIDDVEEIFEYALVLGCSVHKDGTPSLMLKDRLDKSVELYKKNIVNKIIISGDHSDEYSEVEVMYNYLKNEGIDEENIVCDYKGFNTSSSIKNYYNKYKNEKVIIVSQKYHLYRALLLAHKKHMTAIGVHANLVNYYGQLNREIREILARVKDFIIN